MFNNDVTQSYNHQDATMEILVMLAGAFLLGCLLCWLIRKLLETNKHELAAVNVSTQSTNSEPVSLREVPDDANKKQSNTQVENIASTTYTTPKIDDLTKISGINLDIESELRDRGIKSYTDLRDSKKQDIINTLKSSSAKFTSKKEAQTWPHQASLAAKGEWDKLKEYQEFMSRSRQAIKDIKTSEASSNDDLKKIEGIGPKIEELLNKNGINTFEDLNNTDRDTLKGYLDTAGDRFKLHEPESWPHQAGMAEKDQWEELKIYQEFMNDDREIPTSSDFSDMEIPVQPIISDLEADFKKEISKDDLKKIEGIGPKIEELLNTKGISTYQELHQADRDTLKKHLTDAGSQFQVHEPESWPHQAGMAERGEWQELKVYQEFMDGEREIPSASTSAKIDIPIQGIISETKTDSTKPSQDDLTKIEGIDSNIEALLNDNDISTFKELSLSNREALKKLLSNADSQFEVQDPASWPHQAAIAETGDWEELKIFQEFMNSGSSESSEKESSSKTSPKPIQIKSALENQNDNLKKIEGIGPKIQELLNKSGIKSFEDLKNSDRETIKKLLDEAGPQYRMHEPETWPLQARMAFEGEWEKLEEYQDFLMGGRG